MASQALEVLAPRSHAAVRFARSNVSADPKRRIRNRGAGMAYAVL